MESISYEEAEKLVELDEEEGEYILLTDEAEERAMEAYRFAREFTRETIKTLTTVTNLITQLKRSQL